MSSSIGILFDYNGVIVDDEPLHRLAFTGILADFEVRLSQDHYVDYCLGKRDSDAFRELKEVYQRELAGSSVAQLLSMKQDRYQKLLPGHDILYPGVVAILRDLSAECRLAMVTGATRAEVAPFLEPSGIDQLFARVITAEDVTRGKPDPEGYLMGLEALGMSPQRVVVIEDSGPGVKAAKAAGLKCIAVRHTTPDQLLAEADLIIDGIVDLTGSLVKGLIKPTPSA